MALYLSRNEGDDEHGFRRATFEWDSDGRPAELVVERGDHGRLRLRVSIGSEREEHDLDLDGAGLDAINMASKLIKIEDTSPSLPEGTRVPTPPHTQATRVRQRSKLIMIEDTGASLPEATLRVP